jgi:hypothetical protein
VYVETEEELKMRILFTIVALLACLPAAAGEDLLDSLDPGNIAAVRINLNPGGADIGFEAEFDGGDPRLEPLVALLRDAEPGGGHKCPNAGAIRLFLKDESLIGVGLLPSHTEGRYEFRLYDGDRYIEAFIVERDDLLAGMEALGVPTDDHAFRE